MSISFQCDQCGAVKESQGLGTGYGVVSGPDGDKKHCYECCGVNDMKYMIENGVMVLYLTCEPASRMRSPEGRSTRCKVTNWPGTLSFSGYSTVGRHNIAGWRYDVWFKGPDGYEWHGVTYGDNTQICRCKRTKRRWSDAPLPRNGM